MLLGAYFGNCDVPIARLHPFIAVMLLAALACSAQPLQTNRAEDLLAAYREFKQHGVPISFTVNHGVTLSIYFLDPDGNQLEVYSDNPPEEIAKMSNPYFGLDKLDFAPDEPSLREYFARFFTHAEEMH